MSLHNTSTEPREQKSEGLGFFGMGLLTHEPDGYYSEIIPGRNRVLVRHVVGGIVVPVTYDRDENGASSFSYVIYDALEQLIGEAKDKKSLEQEVLLLKEQLAIAKKEKFGASSEKQQEQEKKDTAADSPPAKTKKPNLRLARNAGRKPLPENLPRDTVLHSLSESERGCPCCGTTMRDMGEEITEQLTVIPAQFRVKKHVRKKYSCRDCGKIVYAPKPKSMVPGSSYGSPDFLTHVAIAKYQHGLPFYRQEAIFEQASLPFNRTTLANLMIACADQLAPLTQLLKDELLKQRIIHADETTIQVLKEEGRKPQSKSYLWHYRSAAGSSRQIVLFDYQETRSGEHPKAFLRGYSGYLHVDGYSGYNNIHNAGRVGCMAHLRRKFVEAASAIPAGHGEHSFAQQAIAMIGELYGIEQKLAGRPTQAVFNVRQKESIPILSKFKKWLDDMKPKVVPKSLLGKAIHYAVEQWPTMLRYVDDGDLAIDNNIAEREIKQVVIGRKNWLFADMPEGAYTNAVMYSLVLTARANGLDPAVYLRHVFASLPNLKTAEEVGQLLPWNVKAAMETDLLAA